MPEIVAEKVSQRKEGKEREVTHVGDTLDAARMLALDLVLDGLVLDGLELLAGALAGVELLALGKELSGTCDNGLISSTGQAFLFRITRACITTKLDSRLSEPICSARKGGLRGRDMICGSRIRVSAFLGSRRTC